jgi:hypothetical protein
VTEQSDLGLFHIPFGKATFETIMTEFNLPTTLLQAIVDEELHFSTTPVPSKVQLGATGYILRTASDYFGQQDLVLAASQPTKGLTTALIFGCIQNPPTLQDIEAIDGFLRSFISYIGHPQLLLSLIAVLQLGRYKRQEKQVDIALTAALHGARLSRLVGNAVRVSKNENPKSKAGDIPYNELTKIVLEKFTQAESLAQAMTHFGKLLNRVVSTFPIASPQPPYHEDYTAHIKEYMERTAEKILSLAANNSLAANRASLLMSSVSTMIVY